MVIMGDLFGFGAYKVIFLNRRTDAKCLVFNVMPNVLFPLQWLIKPELLYVEGIWLVKPELLYVEGIKMRLLMKERKSERQDERQLSEVNRRARKVTEYVPGERDVGGKL